MALLMLFLGVLSFAMMNVDIFPAINLPVVISSLEPLNSLRRSQSLLVASAQVRPGSTCRLQYGSAPFELDGQDRGHRSDVGLRRWRRD
jgi:hypothetical protein